MATLILLKPTLKISLALSLFYVPVVLNLFTNCYQFRLKLQAYIFWSVVVSYYTYNWNWHCLDSTQQSSCLCFVMWIVHWLKVLYEENILLLGQWQVMMWPQHSIVCEKALWCVCTEKVISRPLIGLFSSRL